MLLADCAEIHQTTGAIAQNDNMNKIGNREMSFHFLLQQIAKPPRRLIRLFQENVQKSTPTIWFTLKKSECWPPAVSRTYRGLTPERERERKEEKERRKRRERERRAAGRPHYGDHRGNNNIGTRQSGL